MTPARAVRSHLVRMGAAPDGDIDLGHAALVLASMERPRGSISPDSGHHITRSSESGECARRRV